MNKLVFPKQPDFYDPKYNQVIFTCKIGFLSPSGEEVYMEYSDAYSYCQKVVSSFVQKNPSQNKKIFTSFARNYTCFPFCAYFDFVIFKLGYIFLNPFGTFGQFGKVDGKDLSEETSTILYCSRSLDDQTLGLRDLSDQKNYSSIITRDGKILQKKNYQNLHVCLLNHILNQLLMYDPFICEDYCKYGGNGMYLVHRLGFLYFYYSEDGTALIYNHSLLNEVEKKFIQEVRQDGLDPVSITSHFTPVENEQAKQLIKKCEESRYL